MPVPPLLARLVDLVFVRTEVVDKVGPGEVVLGVGVRRCHVVRSLVVLLTGSMEIRLGLHEGIAGVANAP